VEAVEDLTPIHNQQRVQQAAPQLTQHLYFHFLLKELLAQAEVAVVDMDTMAVQVQVLELEQVEMAEMVGVVAQVVLLVMEQAEAVLVDMDNLETDTGLVDLKEFFIL
jgi:hypothetical protein